MLNSKNVNTNQKGFTLIELVVVIVILGILAVTAAPKFINLQDDAQTATLEGVQAAMNSASALVHSKSLIAGNSTLSTTDGDTALVTIDAAGTTVNLDFGYPVITSTEWAKLLDIDTNDFTYLTTVSDTLIIHPQSKVPADITTWTVGDDATDDANCFTYYIVPTAINGTPTIGSVDCQVTP